MKIKSVLILASTLALITNAIKHICFLSGVSTFNNSYGNLWGTFNSILMIALIGWIVISSTSTPRDHNFDIFSWIRNFNDRSPTWLMILFYLIISYGFFLTSVVTVSRLFSFKNIEYYNMLSTTGTPLIV
jgi:hypothetical protein